MDCLPDSLEYLSIRGYKKGANEAHDKEVAALMARFESGSLKLKEIKGLMRLFRMVAMLKIRMTMTIYCGLWRRWDILTTNNISIKGLNLNKLLRLWDTAMSALQQTLSVNGLINYLKLPPVYI
jgi:hypothetical protein